RARFVVVEGAPVVALAASDETPIAITDVREYPSADREAFLDRAATQASTIPFNLAEEAPLRFQLFRTGTDTTSLLISAHHIAIDAWSFAVLAREIQAEYKAVI